MPSSTRLPGASEPGGYRRKHTPLPRRRDKPDNGALLHRSTVGDPGCGPQLAAHIISPGPALRPEAQRTARTASKRLQSQNPDVVAARGILIAHLISAMREGRTRNLTPQPVDRGLLYSPPRTARGTESPQSISPGSATVSAISARRSSAESLAQPVNGDPDRGLRHTRAPRQPRRRRAADSPVT